VKDEIEKKYKEVRKNVSLPGFRKGKAPRKLIEKKFGKSIIEEVKEDLVREAYTQAIDKHELEPVGDPEITLDSVVLEEGSAMEFEFDVETRPELELGEYKGLKVDVPPTTVSDDEIDSSVEGLRNRWATLEKVEEGSIEKEDFPVAAITYSVEGEEDVTREGGQINMKMKIVDGLQVDEETIERFIGRKEDDTVAFEVPALPDHFTPESLRGKKASLSAKISEIKRITPPELNEAFFKRVGIESLDELKKMVREGVETRKKSMQKELAEEKIIDKLVETHELDLPEKLLEKQIEKQQYMRKIEMMRMGFAEKDVEEKAREMKESDDKSADRFLRYTFIFDKIAEKEKIFVTEADVEEELKKIASGRNSTPQEVRAEFEEQDMMSSLRSRVRYDKIREFLRENAEITEKEPEEKVKEA